MLPIKSQAVGPRGPRASETTARDRPHATHTLTMQGARKQQGQDDDDAEPHLRLFYIEVGLGGGYQVGV